MFNYCSSLFYHHSSVTSRTLTQSSRVSYYHLKSYGFRWLHFVYQKEAFSNFQAGKKSWKHRGERWKKDLLNIFSLSITAMFSPTVFYFILFRFKSLKASYSIFTGKLFQCQSAPQEIFSSALLMFISHKMTDIKCFLVSNLHMLFS